MFARGGRKASSRRRALLILPVWAFSVIWMWTWWFQPSHPHVSYLFTILSAALLYEFTILPSVFLYFVLRARKPAKRIAPKGKKVAVISLCVPSSESLNIVENQLKAMSEITYPHDSWILDEGNDESIRKLAKKYGVKHFSRKGILRYNQSGPPFQKKTKAGNVNAWLSHVKRRKYDFFVQLDIDHIPHVDYLHKTLGYFRDSNVAWVQAPSVYKNLDHWTSRGAAEQELVLQGPLQMGFYGHSETPFIIGSHCTYRMSAIREIGGFQPTRAEDHLDTVYLANHGYKGVFLPEVIAEGDGPETLNTYLAQQFAWAYSMFQVLLYHTPRLLKAMPWRRKWQFLFAQTWYPLWSLSYLLLFLSPIVALWLNHNIVTVDGREMLIHFMPLFTAGFLVWWAARPLMQPRNILLSWRGMILHAVRWPIIVRAIIAALFKIKKPYMITPKGAFASDVPMLKTYRPFLLLGFISAFSVIITELAHHGQAPEAQVVFALSNTGFMLTICAVDIALRARQLKPNKLDIKLHWMRPVSATIALALTLTSASYLPITLNNALAAKPVNAASDVLREANYSMTTQELIEQITLIPNLNNPTPSLGKYDKSLNVPKTVRPHIQHVFVDWRDNHYLALAIAKSLQAGNTPLITIEPRGVDDGVALLAGIQSGKYDQLLGDLSSVLAASKNPIYIRFAHEMELSDLYPWSNQSPELYVPAFIHATTILKSYNQKNIKIVWSPAGNFGADDYYPGDEFVDIIGTTVLYDEYWYGSYLPSFEVLASSRMYLLNHHKPLWVVEFGAGKANPKNQALLIGDALANYQKLGFKALVYLDLADANIAGPDYRLGALNDFYPFYEKVLPIPSITTIASQAITKPATLLRTSFQAQ